MTRLTEQDLRAALEIGLETQAAKSVAALRSTVLPAVRSLVPCDLIGYNELDLARGTAIGILDPSDGGFDGYEDHFRRVMHQHPLVKRQQQGDLSVGVLSDFLSTQRFHRLELYHDFYSLLGAEDQLAFGLGGEGMVALALCRPRRGFSERDRALLERLRPHLSLAYRNARERERVQALIDTLQAELEQSHTAVIQIDQRGSVVEVAGPGDDLLDSYFGAAGRRRGRLPAELRDRFAHDGLEKTLTMEGPRGRLQIETAPIEPSAWCTLILKELRVSAPSVEALRALGLTDRQAQVFRLVALGKPNSGIAAELQISPATVRKHLEHIYAALGVTSRAQAIARAYV